MTLTANTTTTVTVVATDNAGRTTTVTRYVKLAADITQNYSDSLNISNYQSGKPFYLIKDGVNKATDLGLTLSNLTVGGDVYYRSGYVELTANSGYKYGFLTTSTKVDLSNYTGIKLTYKGVTAVSGEVGSFGISDDAEVNGSGSIDLNSTYGYLCYETVSSTSKTTVDFSPLPTDRTGTSAYIKFGCINGQKMYVYDLLVY